MPASLPRYSRSSGAAAIGPLSATLGAAAAIDAVAAFTGVGGPSTIRWNPAGTSSVERTPPVLADVAEGWRETTPLNANEQTTIAAGTWAMRVLVQKSGQTVAAAITVRVICVVSRVNSVGVSQAEVGRMTSVDTAISVSAADVIISGSFVTGTPTVLAPGDLLFTAWYVQHLTAGTVAAPAAAVSVNFYSDSSQASAASGITSAPTYTTQFVRSVPDTAGAVDATTRSVSYRRITADAAPTTDVVTRVATFPRATADAAPASDAVTRVATFPRATADTASATDAVTRRTTQARATADTASASDVVSRVLIYVRKTSDNIGPNATDFTVVNGTKSIAGVVRDSAGVPVAGAVVKLFRQGDDRVVQTATSAANGAFSFVRDGFDTNAYYVLSYTAGTPQTHGVTDRDLLPV